MSSQVPPPGVMVPHQSPHLVTVPDVDSTSFLFLLSFLASPLASRRGFTLVGSPSLSPSPSLKDASWLSV